MFAKIDELKQRLDALRPLPPGLVKNLRESFRIEWTYHSNAIEGNTLTLLETKLVIEEGITIGGKRLKEHLEAINHAEAIDFIEELVANKEHLTEHVLKQVHYLVLKSIDNENAGKYRTYNVRISGSSYTPPHFLHIQDEMNQLFSWYETNQHALHPIELAARFHFQLVSIYTFHNHAIKGTMTKKAKAMYPTYRIHRGNPRQSRASRFIAPPAAIRSNSSIGENTRSSIR
ncbi:Fic family protein [Geobacillus stearothermophilus]|uniref:Fic family protein n=1 Tax=Geobacillus stearothermophilus TaxID=1422 RepID=UPI002E207EB1|nr:Fic family protein [Geobacillus stearothermophilus]